METPAYTLANLRAGVVSETGNWEASLYINNLTNDVVFLRLTNSSTSPIGGTVVGAMPRTVGISVTRRFN
jgi:iron complex outermembrane receptor protein